LYKLPLTRAKKREEKNRQTCQDENCRTAEKQPGGYGGMKMITYGLPHIIMSIMPIILNFMKL